MPEVRVCLPDPGVETPWTLDSYKQSEGYSAWERIIREQIPQDSVIDEIKASGIKPGDEISISGYRARTGSLRGHVRSVVLANGQRLDGMSSRPAAD